jgi:SAM-dependent methyltransferase
MKAHRSFRNLARLLRPAQKTAFMHHLPDGSSLFDIGCGNRSAERAKRIKPDLRYVGIDVAEFLQSAESLAAMDRFEIVDPAQFALGITEIGEQFDAVVSSHNIEHCASPDDVIDAMCKALKPGGRLYLAFPSEASARFPKRAGTLNFWDDETHSNLPDWDRIISRLTANGMIFDKKVRRSRPLVFAIAGLIIEPWSAIARKVDTKGAVWAFWGFESIIWARKPL